MVDLALIFNSQGEFDLALKNNDLMGDTGLNTAIIISLFTDRLAKKDDLLPEHLPTQKVDPRGWWGNLLRPEGQVNPIGSRLWLLSREKEEPKVAKRAQEYAQESLSWLTDFGGDYLLEIIHLKPSHLKIKVSTNKTAEDENTKYWNYFLDYTQSQVVAI